jgi:hypothetical protein
MLSLVYSSRATAPFDETHLASLLQQSRADNGRVDLTGMLLHRDGRFLQVLEGPDEAVRERMDAIAHDPRHESIRILLQETTTERLFPEWSMAYAAVLDAAEQPEGFRTTFEDLAGDRDTSMTLPALRELVRWFQERPSA